MITSDKLQILARLNQEMLNFVQNLQNALQTGNNTEVERIKTSFLEFQKKFSQVLYE